MSVSACQYETFTQMISAFANHQGGEILYGIDGKGVVHGQEIDREEKKRIITTVDSIFCKIKWTGGEMQKGRDYDVSFIPVQEGPEGKELYVIRVSVKALPGFSLVNAPESYHMVNGQMQPMAWNTWYDRFCNDYITESTGHHSRSGLVDVNTQAESMSASDYNQLLPIRSELAQKSYSELLDTIKKLNDDQKQNEQADNRQIKGLEGHLASITLQMHWLMENLKKKDTNEGEPSSK